MKTKFTLFFLSFLLCFVMCVNASAGSNPWDIELPFKEATIHYTITGSENGKETLYIRDYGKERVRHRISASNMMFMTTDTNQIEITNPDWVYSIDMKAHTGTKTSNPIKFMIEGYNNLSNADKNMVNQNVKKMGTSSMQSLQGTVQQNADKILGYNCDLVSGAGSTTYSIHETDIVLKSNVGMMGMNFTMDATKIDEGPVASNLFSIPAGIQITYDQEADNAARAMAKSTIETLKSPDASQKMQQQVTDTIYQGEQAAPSRPMDNRTQEEMQKAMDALKGMFGK